MNSTGGNLAFIERNISNLQQIVPYLPKSIASTFSLNVHGNQITRIDGFSLPDPRASPGLASLHMLLSCIRVLDLSSNSIRSFEHLSGLRICQHLHNLNLACNEFTSAQPHLLGRQVLRYILFYFHLFVSLHVLLLVFKNIGIFFIKMIVYIH